jgi:hypothetical protein
MPTDSLPKWPVGEPHGLSPFDLRQRETYLRWREAKLAGYPVDPKALLVEIRDPSNLTPGERQAVLSACRKANMAIYACTGLGPDDPKSALRRLGNRFGLKRLDHNLCADEDGIASLRVVEGGRPQEYIPYSNRPIRWHTDGYYNPPGEQIQGFILHCVCDAASGGANRLLDHEIVYLTMRDEDPDYIRALMEPRAMTIPANLEGDTVLRSTQSGPVFSVSPANGSLHMRYTARTRSIEWAGDALTREAVAFLEQLLNSELPYVYNYRLAPGQGVICNNVLHSREAFADDPASGKTRLFLRARYHDRIAQTAPP